MVALDRTTAHLWRLLAAALFTSAAVALALPAANAAAAFSWVTPSVPVASAVPLGGTPAVAMAESGDATEVWAQLLEGGSATLESATRPAGGAWSAPLPVPNHLHVSEPAIAVTPAGRVSTVWVDGVSGGEQIWSAERGPEGGWGATAPLNIANPQRAAYSPSLALNSSDGGAAVWYEYDEVTGETWVEAASRQGSSWSIPARLSSPGSNVQRYGRIEVVADGHGGFVTLWVQYDELSGIYSVVAEELHEGAWQGAQVIVSSDEPLLAPSVAENAAGEATAVWLNYGLREIESASLRGGEWTPQLIEGSNASTFCGQPQPQVGVNGAGTSTAAWVNTDGEVLTDTMPAGGAWSGASRLTTLPEGVIAREPTLSENSAGAAALVWNRWNLSEDRWSNEASYRPAGGSWQVPTSISPEVSEGVSNPALAMDAAGEALTSWGAGPYGSTVNLEYAYVQLPGSAPTPIEQIGAPSPVPSHSPSISPPGLAPVYLLVPHSRLRLGRRTRTLNATILNRNPFPVTGTATMSYYLPVSRGAHAAGGSISTTIATVAHFALAARGSSRVTFRLSAAALRRLHADVPDSGHDLISIRLIVNGPAGQHASGVSVYALDAPLDAHAHPRHIPVVPPGYGAPVDPWVKAHAAC